MHKTRSSLLWYRLSVLVQRSVLSLAVVTGLLIGAASNSLAAGWSSAPRTIDVSSIPSLAPLKRLNIGATPFGTAPRLKPTRLAQLEKQALRLGRRPMLREGIGKEANIPVLASVEPIAIAAASSVKASGINDFVPNLKPGRVQIKISDTLGESTAPAITSRAPDAIRLGQATINIEEEPHTFFFKADIERAPASAPLPMAFASDIPNAPYEVIGKLKRGEALVDMLRRIGVDTDDRNDAAAALSKKISLRRLRAGQRFRLVLTRQNQTIFQAMGGEPKDSRLLGLTLLGNETSVELARIGEVGEDAIRQFAPKEKKSATTERIVTISGKIKGSLFASAKALGAPDDAIADLANIFAYDIDFQRDIFRGDAFEAVFTGEYDALGRLVSAGDIMFGKLTWRGGARGKNYYRFQSKDGGAKADYFDTSGESAKRLLMKTPIDGARLSSGFGRRRHPVLGYRKAHKGVDFAARRGTPIYAAGDGTIERMNRFGSFGNYVRIRHARGYKTAYAHLQSFKRGLRAGSRVEQGDVIGYVGTTGRSTGPHLHYEVHHKGKAVNPQKLKIATGIKLTGTERKRFLALRDDIDALRGVSEPTVTAAR